MDQLRSRADRGAVHPVLAAGLVVLTIGGSLLAWWAISDASGPNPSGITLSVPTATAVRDSNDLPVVKANFVVDFKIDSPRESAYVVRCTITQGQKTRDRVFVSEDMVRGAGREVAGTVVIAPKGEDDKFISGAFKLSCRLFKDGTEIGETNGPDVTIPAAGGGGEVGDGSDLGGTYTFVPPGGGNTECGPGTFTVTLPEPGRVVFASGTDQFSSVLSPQLNFQVKIELGLENPFFQGTVTGRFVRDGAEVRIDGNLNGTGATGQPCRYDFSAKKGS